MPLDLSQSVDLEIYRLFSGMSGVEAKNFLSSAILYYARSPLVLSANALVDALSRAGLDERFGQVLERIDGLVETFKGLGVSGLKRVDFSGDIESSASPPLASDSVLPDSFNQPCNLTNNNLKSLKQKFKV